MPQQAPNIGLNHSWALGESGWNQQMDENLKTIDALLLLSVKSATTSAPPGSPVEGDRYLIPTGATGTWATYDGKIAKFNGSGWDMFTASTGWEVRTEDSLQQYHFDGTNWDLLGARFGQYLDDSAASANGVPVNGMYINSSTGALTVRLA